MLKVVSWNLARSRKAWRALLETDADIAIVQEAGVPPSDIAARIMVDAEPWCIAVAGMKISWRAAVIKINPEIDVRWLKPHSINDAGLGEFAVSRLGTLAAAEVHHPATKEKLTMVSMYSLWERPHSTIGSRWIYADASAHRLISDLSIFIGHQRNHRIIAAGDLNLLYGYGEYGNAYWASRYMSVFDRMEALGLKFVGPQFPNGIQADPWPSELPPNSLNVPTFRTKRKMPESGSRQLDYVFASNDLASRVAVRALNQPENWGPSDHCRIMIDVLE